jgi:hypothetical protein
MQEMNGEVNIEGLIVRQVAMPRIRFMGAPVNDQDRNRAAELTSVASGFADKVCLNLDRLESFVLANHFSPDTPLQEVSALFAGQWLNSGRRRRRP